MLPPPCEFQKHNSQSWKVNWSSGLRLWPRWMIVNGDVIWCYKKVHWPFTDFSQSGRLCFWSLQTPRRLNIVTGCTCRGWMVTMWRDGVHLAFIATFGRSFMTPTCPSFWWCFFGFVTLWLDLSTLHFAPDGAFESWFFKNITTPRYLLIRRQVGCRRFSRAVLARTTFPEITIDCFVHLLLLWSSNMGP